MRSKNTQQAIEWHHQFISAFSYGYFITINSNRFEGIHWLGPSTFDDFEAKLRSIVHGLNVYCLGRPYQRNEKRLQSLVAMEIGKENSRLHSHIFALSDTPVGRTVPEVDTRLRRKIVGSYGLPTENDAIDVQEFLPALALNGGNKYFHKCSDYMMNKYGVANCFIV